MFRFIKLGVVLSNKLYLIAILWPCGVKIKKKKKYFGNFWNNQEKRKKVWKNKNYSYTNPFFQKLVFLFYDNLKTNNRGNLKL